MAHRLVHKHHKTATRHHNMRRESALKEKSIIHIIIVIAIRESSAEQVPPDACPRAAQKPSTNRRHRRVRFPARRQ